MDRKKKVETAGNQKITKFMKSKNIKEPKKQSYNAFTPLQSVHEKKTNKPHSDYHPSSREGSAVSSRTQPVDSEKEDIPESYVCHQLIMVGPCDVSYYNSSIKPRLEKLDKKYSKEAFIKTIQENAKYSKIKDLRNLEEIENDEFWSRSVPFILEVLLKEENQKKISSCVEMLVSGRSKIVSISKFKIFLILANMLMCCMPKQAHKYNLSFVELLGTKENDSPKSRLLRREKLKCIVNYFNQISKRSIESLEESEIQVQRVKCTGDVEYMKTVGYNLIDAEIGDGHIEDYYKEAIMVDFANKSIGGGILGNGAVQEEILFAIFPELIGTICFCPDLADDEALIFYNAERFNDYEGYSTDFKFTGNYKHKENKSEKSIIVAIDAVDYKSKMKNVQYLQKQIIRQLRKSMAGFEGVEMGAEKDMWICTGRWGCGAFGGDIYLKFLIQWISCSVAQRKMLYLSQDEVQKKELKVMVNYLKDKFLTSDIMEAIEDYGDTFRDGCKINFLDFFKYQL